MNNKMHWATFVLLLLMGVVIVLPTVARKSTKPVDGQSLFQQHCASCHQGGDNKVNPNRPVANSKVLITLASFKNYLKYPPGHMPYYQHIVSDDAVLKALYNYCKQLKSLPTKQACL
ncbi:hypothetical protein BH10CYA1_BH10CYA1_13720 [soil metagenome]